MAENDANPPKRSPSAVDQAISAAVAHHRAGRLTEAETLYREALALDPDNPDALHLCGVIQAQQGARSSAIDLIRRAIVIRPAFPDALNNLANALHADGRLDDAAETYRRALALKPDYAEAHYNLGNVLHIQGRAEAAIRHFEAALDLKPDYPAALCNLGNALQELGRVGEAVTRYRQALSLNADHSAARQNLARAERALAATPRSAVPLPAGLTVRPDHAQILARLSRDPTAQDAIHDPVRRVALAAQFIPAGARVLVMGLVPKAQLETTLPNGCRLCYPDAITGTWPPKTDIDIILALEPESYPGASSALITALRAFDRPLVLDHEDHPTLFARKAAAAGYCIQATNTTGSNRTLVRLLPVSRDCGQAATASAPRPPRVHVLSFRNAGNFGDRLGFHLLSHLLPAHAVLTDSHFKPWDFQEADAIDLLIVGIGNSLFGRYLDTKLLGLIERSRCAIGIFGTQYRRSLPTDRLNEVLDRLSMWYARSEEDILLYGRGRTNVRFLGDWLIGAFPLTQARDDRLLTVEDEIWNDLPLDRSIQQIQRHRAVYSSRLHPLLCALTSAERVAYREQREDGDPTHVSGKFRSLFLDVFGRDWPEDTLFPVDRPHVAAYKARVHRGIDALKADISALLASCSAVL